jgi:hypothetical protein
MPVRKQDKELVGYLREYLKKVERMAVNADTPQKRVIAAKLREDARRALISEGDFSVLEDSKQYNTRAQAYRQYLSDVSRAEGRATTDEEKRILKKLQHDADIHFSRTRKTDLTVWSKIDEERPKPRSKGASGNPWAD